MPDEIRYWMEEDSGYWIEEDDGDLDCRIWNFDTGCWIERM
jgi:hypothetical protein